MDSDAYDILTTDDEYIKPLVCGVPLSDIRAHISTLANNSWHNPHELDRDHTVRYSYVAINNCIEDASEEDIDVLNTIISRQYKPTKIVPGTIGFFLFGCKRGNTNISMGCTPSCINGIGRSNCKYQVWYETDKMPIRFSRIYMPEVDNGNAYVFTSTEFEYFTEQEIQTFILAGITNISAYATSGTEHVLVDKIDDIDLYISPSRKFRDDEKIINKDNTWTDGYISIAIAVIIFIVFIALFLRAYN